jgi:hypothetical protein
VRKIGGGGGQACPGVDGVKRDVCAAKARSSSSARGVELWCVDRRIDSGRRLRVDERLDKGDVGLCAYNQRVKRGRNEHPMIIKVSTWSGTRNANDRTFAHPRPDDRVHQRATNRFDVSSSSSRSRSSRPGATWWWQACGAQPPSASASKMSLVVGPRD